VKFLQAKNISILFFELFHDLQSCLAAFVIIFLDLHKPGNVPTNNSQLTRLSIVVK
jgi:hypothetical protein